MKIEYDSKFLKQVKKLPKNQQAKLAFLIPLLQQNPYDSKLHTKQLNPPLQGIFSFRIDREYRALFYFTSSDSIFLTHAKHRKDIYKNF